MTPTGTKETTMNDQTHRPRAMTPTEKEQSAENEQKAGTRKPTVSRETLMDLTLDDESARGVRGGARAGCGRTVP